jgi:hypothetical protein
MSSQVLKRLNAAGRDKVNTEFRSGLEEFEVSDSHIESLDRNVHLDQFNDILNNAMDEYERYDSSMDGRLSVQLHKALPLTRREAADIGVWAFLACCERPDFVRYRWEPGSTGAITEARFLNMRRNAFSRLWWAAELTEDDGDYSLTEKLWSASGAQDLLEATIGRNFSHYRPAFHAFVEVLGEEKRDNIRTVAKRQSQALTTLVLESMSKDDIEDMLYGFLERVKSKEVSV